MHAAQPVCALAHGGACRAHLGTSASHRTQRWAQGALVSASLIALSVQSLQRIYWLLFLQPRCMLCAAHTPHTAPHCKPGCPALCHSHAQSNHHLFDRHLDCSVESIKGMRQEVVDAISKATSNCVVDTDIGLPNAKKYVVGAVVWRVWGRMGGWCHQERPWLNDSHGCVTYDLGGKAVSVLPRLSKKKSLHRPLNSTGKT